MKTASENKNAYDAVNPREPLYASIWLALFFDLRREFALARSAS